MQITVTFDNLDEMREFTEKVLVGAGQITPADTAEPAVGAALTMQPEKITAAVPTAPTVPVAPAAPAVSAVSTVPTAPVAPAVPPALAVPTAPVVPAAPAAQVPTTAVTYTPDDLARAAMALMDSGKQQELIGLLGQFGVVAIPELRPEQYGAFATALRGMGAQI